MHLQEQIDAIAKVALADKSPIAAVSREGNALALRNHPAAKAVQLEKAAIAK